MYNKGDNSYLAKEKVVPFSVVEALPSMLRAEALRTGFNDFRVALHGGEPLLIGKAYFKKMMDFLVEQCSDINVSFGLQTNGTLLDLEWTELFKKYPVSVSVSLDGTKEINFQRKYHNGRSSFEDVVKGIKLLQYENVNFGGVISVVQPYSSGAEVVRFFINELGLNWFDFLLPDYSHDDLPPDWDSQQESFSSFLKDAFETWLPHSKKGIVCRFFDNALASLFNFESLVDTIGREGLSSIIIETDGSLEPHDVFRICDGFDRNSRIVVGDGALEKFITSSLFEKVINKNKEYCTKCSLCNFFSICKGGHMTHRYSKTNGFLNPSVHCYTLYHFIDYLFDFVEKRFNLGNNSLKQNCIGACGGETQEQSAALHS